MKYTVGVILMLLPALAPVSGFVPPQTASRLTFIPQSQGCYLPRLFAKKKTSSSKNSDKVIDADFERVVDVYDGGSTSKEEGSKKKQTPAVDDDDDDGPKSLLDMALEADPRWKDTRIPFCMGDEYIDGKLAFISEVDGAQYGIAVPYDEAVAIIIQEPGEDGKEAAVEYVDPDLYSENEEYQELMEIMATQVQQEFGEELVLRKTPKVLTISGGLNQITDKWESKVFGEPVPVEELLKTVNLDGKPSDDGEISEFMDFMRQELGEEEFEKTLMEASGPEDDEMTEMMKLFEVPGINGDPEELQDLIASMAEDLKEDAGVRAKAKEFEVNKDDMALKLISFEIKSSGKSYALVKLLRPYVLVGRLEQNEEPVPEDSKEEPRIRFELLNPEEEQAVIPKLESMYKEKLTEAGLNIGQK